MPNHIQINGKDNNGSVQLLLNDALLRTADDRVFLSIDNRDGGAFDLAVYVGTAEAAKLVYAAEPLESHLPRIISQRVVAGAVVIFVVSRIDGKYFVELEQLQSTDCIMWDELLNCKYENNEFCWTGGDVKEGVQGFTAIASTYPHRFITKFIGAGEIYLGIGSSLNLDLMDVKDADKGIMFSINLNDSYSSFGYLINGEFRKISLNPKNFLVWNITNDRFVVTDLDFKQQAIINFNELDISSAAPLYIFCAPDKSDSKLYLAHYINTLPDDVTIVYHTDI